MPCSLEEADSRMVVHARDATTGGSKSIIIKANDTAVLAIAISVLPSLQELGLEKGQELSLEEVIELLKLKDMGHTSLNFAFLATANDEDIFFAIDSGRFNQR